MTRVSNWEEALFEEVQGIAKTPFKWSYHDCLLWSFKVRYALTQKKGYEEWEGCYSSQEEGRVFFHSLGFDTLADVVSSVVGPPQLPLLAQRGDFVLISEENLGVCIGHEVLTLCDKGGVKRTDLMDALISWRIL
jgi:hypothetical protein